jgi:toxin ParE1/3/4
MKVRFTDPAIRDLAEFHTYVSAENPPAADKLLLRIIDLAQNQLALFPNCGRTGRVDGAREPAAPGTPYIAAYRVVKDEVQVLAIIHAARRWPDSFS